jgi:hypothetical protein
MPRVVMAATELQRLPIDARAGYLLSCIDGQTPVEGLVDVTGFPTSEVVGLLVLLANMGAIAVE